MDIKLSAVTIGANAPPEILTEPAVPQSTSCKRTFNASPEAKVGRSRKVSIQDMTMSPDLREVSQQEVSGGDEISNRRNTWSGLLCASVGRKKAKGRRILNKPKPGMKNSLIGQPLITRLFKPSNEKPDDESEYKCGCEGNDESCTHGEGQ